MNLSKRVFLLPFLQLLALSLLSILQQLYNKKKELDPGGLGATNYTIELGDK